MAVISVEQTRVNVQQNRTMQQLTILATIFLPLTFITGFFGQNFKWMTDHIESLLDFMFFGVCGLLVPLVLLITWMRLRMPHVDTRVALIGAAGADSLPSSPGPRQRTHAGSRGPGPG